MTTITRTIFAPPQVRAGWPLRRRAACWLARLAVIACFLLGSLLIFVGKLAWDSLDREGE